MYNKNWSERSGVGGWDISFVYPKQLTFYCRTACVATDILYCSTVVPLQYNTFTDVSAPNVTSFTRVYMMFENKQLYG